MTNQRDDLTRRHGKIVGVFSDMMNGRASATDICMSIWHEKGQEAVSQLTCPKATAPPRVFTTLLSKPKTFSAAIATTENASLNSHRAISSLFTPAFFSAAGTASVGAVGKSIGAQAASAKPINQPTANFKIRRC